MSAKTIALSGICALLFAAGCYSPDLSGKGGFTCTEKEKSCPGGYTCNPDTLKCEKKGTSPNPDLGPGLDQTVPSETAPVGWTCNQIGSMNPAGTNLIGQLVAGVQFGLAYYPPGDEVWVSFKDAVDVDGGGLLYALRKSRTSGASGWANQGAVPVAAAAGGHSDIVAFDEVNSGNNPLKKVIALYQSARGLNAWDVLQDGGIGGDNPMVIHDVDQGGYFPAFVPTPAGLAGVHAVLDQGAAIGQLWFVPPPDETQTFFPEELAGPAEPHGLALSAVGVPPGAMGDVPGIMWAYYTHKGDGGFGYQVASRFEDGRSSFGAVEGYEIYAVTPERLGTSLALVGNEPSAAYIFKGPETPPDSEQLRFGSAEAPGAPVEPFPVPAANPTLASDAGHVAILAFDANTGVPHLAFRPAGERAWLEPLALGPDLRAKVGSRPRLISTEADGNHIRLVAAFISQSRRLMVGEIECQLPPQGL